MIANAPCLAFFDVDKEVVLQVDASESGLGGALLQPNDQGKLQPVAFTSCAMKSNEKIGLKLKKRL